MESNVNREIRNYHEGVVMGLSVRQTVCGLLAAGLAAAANFGLQPFLGTELASVVCISGGGNSGSNRLCVLSWSAL